MQTDLNVDIFCVLIRAGSLYEVELLEFLRLSKKLVELKHKNKGKAPRKSDKLAPILTYPKINQKQANTGFKSFYFFFFQLLQKEAIKN